MSIWKVETVVSRAAQKDQGPYCAVMGGSEAYGKFVEEPFPILLERMTDKPVINLGYMNAGLDVFANDHIVLDICADAETTIIQIMGAQNITNRFYSVHPRRNDRFLNASDLLRTIFRDVDFTEIHFTRHLLSALAQDSEEKFQMVKDELRNAWLARMRLVLAKIKAKVVLLWLSEKSPDTEFDGDILGPDPLFVARRLIGQLSDFDCELVEVVASEEEILAGQERMIFTQLEQPKAQEMLGPVVHEAVERSLCADERHTMKNGPQYAGHFVVLTQ